MSSDTEWLVHQHATNYYFFKAKKKDVFLFIFQGAVSFTSEVRGESRLKLYVLPCSYISALYSQTGEPVSYSKS